MFNDEGWDGEPIEPADSTSEASSGEAAAGKRSTSDAEEDNDNAEKPKRLNIRLSDGKVLELQSMTSTYFYVDGKPISAEEFLNHLFDTIELPRLLESEEKLRELWSNPITRRDLLEKLEKEGCHKEDLVKLQELIEAENSDLFDVLE